MNILKRQMQDGHLHIPRDPELMNEMCNERFELSKPGQLRFSHPAGTHDDRLWAVAMAVCVARNEIPEYHPVEAIGRNPNYIEPKIDLRTFTSRAGAFNTPLLANQPESLYIHGGHVVPMR